MIIRMEVITRYQMQATISNGIGLYRRVAMAVVANCNSNVNGTALTSDVVLSMPMNSLPVGGMMMRMACGSTMRRMIRERFMPKALAASVWPGSTASKPARTISAR